MRCWWRMRRRRIQAQSPQSSRKKRQNQGPLLTIPNLTVPGLKSGLSLNQARLNFTFGVISAGMIWNASIRAGQIFSGISPERVTSKNKKS